MSITAFLAHISEKPWSDYSESDYTLEQWHKACLIHLHDGASTSKSQCKLPVKTPNGAVNRNGVHAAAAVLAGARGGVHASTDQIASAKKSIVSLYNQLNEKPPPSIHQSDDNVEEFLDHHGIKGQRWGVRKPRGDRSAFIKPKTKGPDLSKMSNDDLRAAVNRMQLEKQFKDLSNSKSTSFGKKFASEILKDVGKQHVKTALTAGIGAASSLVTGVYIAKRMGG